MSSKLETEIHSFGKKIFAAIGSESPTGFNPKNITGKIMNWAMSQPNFKINLFRLVDVLPTLKTNAAIAKHISEYLSQSAAEISGMLSWAMRVKPNSPKAPIAALTVKKSVKQMAKSFIAGESPQEALDNLHSLAKDQIAYTVDLLGEYSLSEKEALDYHKRYKEAFEVLGAVSKKNAPALMENHPTALNPVCVSIKLSALYSQCSPLNFDRSVEVLSNRLGELKEIAKKHKALIYVDAEDVGHNTIIYETFKIVFGEDKEFYYPGIVVQAYAKESKEIVEDLLDFAKKRGNPIAIRLVKGAYWDYETVIANQNQWESPLFSEKAESDLQYENLSKLLLENHEICLPAFGSHNIRSLTHACCYAKEIGLDPSRYELQMLFGMARPIATAFAKEGYFVRMYVPIGKMIPGMGYLVRRLLENTSNESFLKHTFADSSEVQSLLKKPSLQEGVS